MVFLFDAADREAYLGQPAVVSGLLASKYQACVWRCSKPGRYYFTFLSRWLLLQSVYFTAMCWSSRAVVGPGPDRGARRGSRRGVKSLPKNTFDSCKNHHQIFQGVGIIPCRYPMLPRALLLCAMENRHSTWQVPRISAGKKASSGRVWLTALINQEQDQSFGWRADLKESMGFYTVYPIGSFGMTGRLMTGPHTRNLAVVSLVVPSWDMLGQSGAGISSPRARSTPRDLPLNIINRRFRPSPICRPPLAPARRKSGLYRFIVETIIRSKRCIYSRDCSIRCVSALSADWQVDDRQL